MDDPSRCFRTLLDRIRQGDEQAAEELVRNYEAVVRLEVRMRMRSQQLRRMLDSMDICQSVLASFFVRVAAGQYQLDQPQDLVRLLVAMVRNKVALEARRHQCQRRDMRRQVTDDSKLMSVSDPQPSPSELVAGSDLLTVFRQHLDPQELQLADLRGQGYQWSEVAQLMGGTAQARRKQLERAIDRVSRELGLDDDEVS